MASAFNNIGASYALQGDAFRAKESFKASVDICFELGIDLIGKENYMVFYFLIYKIIK